MHASAAPKIQHNEFLHATAPGTATALRLYFTAPAPAAENNGEEAQARTPGSPDAVRETGNALAAWQASVASATEWPDLILAHESAAELDDARLVQFAVGFARFSTVLWVEEEGEGEGGRGRGRGPARCGGADGAELAE